MDTLTITPYVDAVHRCQVIALWESVFGYEATHNKPNLVILRSLARSWRDMMATAAGFTPLRSLPRIEGKASVRDLLPMRSTPWPKWVA
ncbi:MAG: hypothetical protein ABSG53_27025 [Thermoguttaceae bacterium]